MVAQRRVGGRYSDGDGVAHDAHAALEWFSLAAAAGDALSQYRLGLIYETGPRRRNPPAGSAAHSPCRRERAVSAPAPRSRRCSGTAAVRTGAVRQAWRRP